MSGSLREIQEAMRAALHERRPEALLPYVADGRRSPAAQLAVYEGMYFDRLLDAMREDFPRVAELAGEALFPRLAMTHVKKRPSSHPSLAFLGRGFDATLSELGLAEEAAVARLELARSDAFWSPDAPAGSAPLTVEALGALGDRLGEAVLVFPPSLSVIELPAWAPAVALGAPLPPKDARDARLEPLAVWRHDVTVHHTPLDPLGGRALVRALAGETVGAVCELFLEAEVPDPGAAVRDVLLAWTSRAWVLGTRSAPSAG